MNPLVSVVVPNLDYAKYLEDCLNSIVDQTYQPLEILFVDDGSKDASLEIAKRFDKIRIFSQSHQGVNAARNLGIRNATGEFIAFCDSDDLWMPNKIAEQIDFLTKHPDHGLVYSDIQLVSEDLVFIRNQKARFFGDCSRYFLTRPSEAIILLGASTSLMRRQIALELNGFDTTMKGPGEDWDFFRRVTEKTLVDFIPKPLVSYRQHESSASRVSSEKYFDGNRAALRKLFRENVGKISFFARRRSWIKLHWSFFKTEFPKRKYGSALTQLLRFILPIYY